MKLLSKIESTFATDPPIARCDLIHSLSAFPVWTNVDKFVIDVTPAAARKVGSPSAGTLTLHLKANDEDASMSGVVCYTRRRLKSGLVRLFFKPAKRLAVPIVR